MSQSPRQDLIDQMKEKEEIARQEGIKSIILDLRFLLSKLKIIPIADTSFNSYTYMRKHSPLYKIKGTIMVRRMDWK